VFLCLYCGHECKDEQRSIEHPLARAIGGNGWSTEDVCSACNERTGRDVDRPFASDPIVRLARHRFDVRDARGQVPQAPRLYGKTKTGAPIELELGKEAPSTRRVPYCLSRADGRETYIVEPGEGEEILELRLERLQRQLGIGYAVKGRVEEVRLDEDQEAAVEWSIPIDMWPRFGAKLGLAFGAQGMGSDWVRSDWAAWLRRQLAGENTPAPDNRSSLRALPEALGDDDPLALFVDPPQHLIWFVDGEIVMLMVHLFGLWRYVVPLGPATRQDRPAWRFDPREGKAQEMAFIELAVSSAEKMNTAG
jgi:HNH endonuclease